MQFDMITMSAVDLTVTTVLGLVLLFTWLRERGARLVGWWGLIMLLQADAALYAAKRAGVTGLSSPGRMVLPSLA
jgi:hypothetical protein